MERYRKKELLQTTATLMKANDSVCRVILKGSQDLADVFMQCQEAAIQIGTYLEACNGKYVPMVRILEDYCENIYQMSENVQDKEFCRQLSKKIGKQLTQLHNRIKWDMPEDRKEVVFLPYKVSMWDSLESVWKAADADENTDAYVIPIPYYDKNPDGSFREEHYEGDLYPDYVPVIRYEEYNFEERRPDTVYIHNAYDNDNHITSVHPFFYSKNIKQFTEELIYIPYFVLPEIKPEDKEAIEAMKHFCTIPGVFSANKVIVQSEDMRQVYINVLTEVTAGSKSPEEQKKYREYWEDKIDGGGSPKFAKAFMTKKEDLEIPDDWIRIIEKPDKSFKKIILYNTSISTLLKDNEKVIEKMKKVFETFYANREDIAVLWRPHPLLESAIVSMRSKLWKSYQEIRDGFIQGKWGIYDDTPDLNRAILISDAYYGDQSSVVELYQKTGKPVMIQNVDVD